MSTTTAILPRAFIKRRLHSLFGLWFVLFLIEHLLTNSQAALLIGDQGAGFMRFVNFLKGLPYLPVIEVVLLGVPIFFHMIWGIKYLFAGKLNAQPSKGTTPSLPQYKRNQAFTWQRVTSWILVVGIIAHVIEMRFYHYPKVTKEGDKTAYFVRLDMDNGLYTVADRLGVKLFDKDRVQEQKGLFAEYEKKMITVEKEAKEILAERSPTIYYSESNAETLEAYQKFRQKKEWIEALSSKSLKEGQVIGVTKDFGTAELFVVRDTFKNVFISFLYTVFVLTACFHAFNGLWTALITWGIVLKARSQSTMVHFCYGLMFVVIFLGLATIWGTYWLNLKN